MFVTRIYKLKNVLYYTIIGTIFGELIGFLLHYIDNSNSLISTLRGFFIGFFVGTSIGFCEEFLFLDKFRRKSYLFLLLFRSLVYAPIFVFFELFVNSSVIYIFGSLTIIESINSACTRNEFPRDLSILVFTSVTLIALLQIRRLHRPGDLLKYIIGKYHIPEEVNKIFLFIDLKSSTSIAEKLGNKNYSSFLIDYFHDMTGAILMSKAEIYQYIGDEIILTWNFAKGIKYSRCIHCFFDIKYSIELNKKAYLNKYGIIPEFKAALHSGKVSVTWIGSIKKEIVYHGDVLNTTARIQAECNKYGQYFLISEYMLNNLQLPEFLRAEFVGDLELRGKNERVKIFGLKSIAED